MAGEDLLLAPSARVPSIKHRGEQLAPPGIPLGAAAGERAGGRSTGILLMCWTPY